MNLLDRFLLPIQLTHNLKSVISEPSDLSKVASIFPGIPIPPESNTADFEETYKTVSYVYRAANVRAKSVAGLPHLIEQKVGDEWVDITDEVTLYPYRHAGGILISICDGKSPSLGNAEIWLGANGAEKIHPRALRDGKGKYKIESTGVTTSDGCAYFRIFKKVMK